MNDAAAPEQPARTPGAHAIELWLDISSREDRAIGRTPLAFTAAQNQLQQLIVERDDLRRRLESIRLVASTLPHAVDANPYPDAARRVVTSLGHAIDTHAALDQPIGHIPTEAGLNYLANRRQQHPRGEDA